MSNNAQIPRDVINVWAQIISTLQQRNLLKRGGEGKLILPQANAYLFKDRVIFDMDMQRLGNIPLEIWTNPKLRTQLRVALKRRVVVTSKLGLAIQVGREPLNVLTTRITQITETLLLPDSTSLPSKPHTVTLGTDSAGATIELDISGAHRAIITGGTSGSGKTNFMKSVILQLAMKHDPDTLQIAIVDTKEVDFPAFEGLPHLFAKIAYDLDEADELIKAVETERLRRKALLRTAGVSNWLDIPEGERFPLLLLIVDEAADFKGRPAMDLLVQIARKGRAMGISLLLGTQHPTVSVIDSQVKANLPIAIAFQTATIAQSNTLLDRAGAEKLDRPGLALAFLYGKWRTIQTLLVTPEAVKAIIGTSVENGPCPLSKLEVALVQYAICELDGKFVIGKLYSAMRASEIDGYMSKPRLEELGQSWEAIGYLSPPRHATDSRKVTKTLLSALSASLSALSASQEDPTPPPDSSGAGLSTPDSPISLSDDPGAEAGPDELPPFMKNRRQAYEF